ncbi:2-amino-4-hydroxy-6-hydroxymethyldihydropteridine diphosphokinase [Frigidibacter albus]|uniref:2-amino-4-hydroxy-6-hydroxymethyldihydropteridine pyrophosphokinase n=2 Tax=Frigidibacter albus TaxID=1465486 RepID=A0A6L8VF83_9RHOB|nr:2-amino-4-hydroxy-6-hydroxymethyldihydropteridine diphosphokinase [Frigidibacter albus]NBE29845.1 2-amino-4-hydroxy-6-hydroxymethyldihydropteridine diphosphokinase [Frigidibacter albus]GGH42417.1 2-amino-4-hydroxy-6-hydroxymethyldihydropteridine pyrophosphokinase [Frigidibacter albus]
MTQRNSYLRYENSALPQVAGDQGNFTAALVALGANLPKDGKPPEVTLRHALASLPNQRVQIQAVSRFFRSPAYPAGSGPDYVNAVALLHVRICANELLAHLHTIEAQIGRTRMSRWGARVVDLDLLSHGSAVLPDALTESAWREMSVADQVRATPGQLILPHPRIADRAFVLVPLAEVAPGWVHPATGQGARAMLAALPEADKAALRPL